MGLGRLTFSDQSVYEGTVYKAFRHGEGLQCMYGSPVMYSGEWYVYSFTPVTFKINCFLRKGNKRKNWQN